MFIGSIRDDACAALHVARNLSAACICWIFLRLPKAGWQLLYSCHMYASFCRLSRKYSFRRSLECSFFQTGCPCFCSAHVVVWIYHTLYTTCKFSLNLVGRVGILQLRITNKQMILTCKQCNYKILPWPSSYRLLCINQMLTEVRSFHSKLISR